MAQIEFIVSRSPDAEDLSKFTSTRLNAVNSSFNGRVKGKYGDRDNPEVSYEAWSQNSKEWYTPKKGWTAVRFNVGSITDSQQIGIDGEYVINSFNRLVEENPELDIKPVELVRMDDGLRLPAKKIQEEAKRKDFDEKNPDIN